MSDTGQYPDFSGLTFEKVWASIQESRREFRESHEKFQQELRQSHEDAERETQKLREQIMETDRQMKETDRRMEEADLRMKEEFDRQIKETNLIIGRLGNRYGELMESLVRPGVAKKFNELGYSFDGESHNLIIKDPFTKQRQTELDVILENGDSVVVVEIKINPCNADVEHFAEQLQYFREYRERNIPNDTKKIFGALAAAVFPEQVQNFALDAGYYVIVPSGESIKIVVPEKVGLKAF